MDMFGLEDLMYQLGDIYKEYTLVNADDARVIEPKPLGADNQSIINDMKNKDKVAENDDDAIQR